MLGGGQLLEIGGYYIARNGMEWNGLFHSVLFQILLPKTILNLSILYLSLDPKLLRYIFLTLKRKFM